MARWRRAAPFPHPAHQTGRADFPHPAFRQGLTLSHTRGHAVASGTLFAFACNAACSFPIVSGVVRPTANLLTVATSDVCLESRPLPSTGITRLHRYYGPLRHPTRPEPSLAGARLKLAASPVGASRVAPDRHMHACCRHYPGRTAEVFGRYCPCKPGFRQYTSATPAFPALTPGRLLQTSCFGACSAFTHVTACMLAKSPKVTLYTGVLQPLRYLRDRSDCYRLERPSCRAGIAPADDRRLITAHAEV